MEDVRFSLERLYPERKLAFSVAAGLTAVCTEDDLGEMIGNLADNACKWATQTVRISATRSGVRVLIQIEDDGPGLNEDQRARALMRGERLDEGMPGHGLGLSITDEARGASRRRAAARTLGTWRALRNPGPARGLISAIKLLQLER